MFIVVVPLNMIENEHDLIFILIFFDHGSNCLDKRQIVAAAQFMYSNRASICLVDTRKKLVPNTYGIKPSRYTGNYY